MTPRFETLCSKLFYECLESKAKNVGRKERRKEGRKDERNERQKEERTDEIQKEGRSEDGIIYAIFFIRSFSTPAIIARCSPETECPVSCVPS